MIFDSGKSFLNIIHIPGIGFVYKMYSWKYAADIISRHFQDVTVGGKRIKASQIFKAPVTSGFPTCNR